jgi:hypothetical protein
MGSLAVIRPEDDAEARQASDWCNDLLAAAISQGHVKAADVDQTRPADATNIKACLAGPADLACYFGHGNADRWLTKGAITIDKANVSAGAQKCIVSIACKTSRNLGPDAVVAGVRSWLGFTIAVAVIPPHKTRDPLGEAIVNGLASLCNNSTMQQARDLIASELDRVATDYEAGGKYASDPSALYGYFAATAMRDHVVVHGDPNFIPLP